jgi:hypothetical protein
MENNLITHLETIITLIIVAVVFIGLPYLTGLLIDKLLNVKSIRRDHVAIWIIGSIGLAIIGIFVLGIYCAYIDIFTYYTKLI